VVGDGSTPPFGSLAPVSITPTAGPAFRVQLLAACKLTQLRKLQSGSSTPGRKRISNRRATVLSSYTRYALNGWLIRQRSI
jgi:hypothetical protein